MTVQIGNDFAQTQFVYDNCVLALSDNSLNFGQVGALEISGQFHETIRIPLPPYSDSFGEILPVFQTNLKEVLQVFVNKSQFEDPETPNYLGVIGVNTIDKLTIFTETLFDDGLAQEFTFNIIAVCGYSNIFFTKQPKLLPFNEGKFLVPVLEQEQKKVIEVVENLPYEIYYYSDNLALNITSNSGNFTETIPLSTFYCNKKVTNYYSNDILYLNTDQDQLYIKKTIYQCGEVFMQLKFMNSFGGFSYAYLKLSESTQNSTSQEYIDGLIRNPSSTSSYERFFSQDYQISIEINDEKDLDFSAIYRELSISQKVYLNTSSIFGIEPSFIEVKCNLSLNSSRFSVKLSGNVVIVGTNSPNL